MENRYQTRKDLIKELGELRSRIAEMEAREADRIQSEETLRVSEERFRKIIETVEEGYYELDLSGSFTFVNDSAGRILGYEREELIGKNFRKFLDEDNAKRSFEAFNRVYRTGEAIDLFDYEVIRKDGTKRNLELSISLIKDSRSGPSVFYGIGRDVTDRKRSEDELRKAHEELERRVEERTAELVESNEALKREIAERRQAVRALKESEEKYRQIIENIEEGYYEVDLAGNMVFLNDSMCRTLGYSREELTGLNNRAYMDEKNAKKVYQIFNVVYRTGKPTGMFGWEVIRKDGSARSVESSVSLIRDSAGKPCGFRGISMDVTDRKRAEEELSRVDKLESIGVLAGGIAHDFNNILTAIQGNISLAGFYEKSNEKVIERLKVAEEASIRARDLIRQLLTFSKGGAPIKSAASIADLVRDSCEFAVTGSNVRCEFAIPDDVWAVEVDRVQISQVIGNLVINADQAMPEGGLIQVRIENVHVTADDGLPVPHGNYVRILIEDTGLGIGEEILPKVFDPYFTTKSDGSGLGLAAAYSIIKGHQGLITVKSEYGIGATFHVYLPASARKIRTSEPKDDEILPGAGRILIMDDEDSIREMVCELLSMLGYEVETATDGEKMIERYRQAKDSGRPFGAVILDLTVPGGMGGREAIRRLVEIDPDVRAIVSSGYSQDPIMAEYRKFGFSGVIPKPYSGKQLSEVLNRVLAQNDR